MTMSPFCIPNVMESATKNIENRLPNKHCMSENNFQLGFFYCINVSNGSNYMYFPGKDLN